MGLIIRIRIREVDRSFFCTHHSHATSFSLLNLTGMYAHAMNPAHDT